MGKEKLIKATKEALLARAEQSKDDKMKYRSYESEELGMTLYLKRLPISRLCEIMDMSEDDTMKAAMEMNCNIIYESVPLFQDKELQAAYGCIEPTEIVTKVMNENMSEIEKMCTFIMGGYGMTDQVEKVKN
ncbi:MAG: hypothetical protein UC961_03800 [Emergencia sp.]|nr:hypothetical protein [Emergencia sp.]